MFRNRPFWLAIALATPILALPALPLPASAVTWTRVEEVPADDVFSIRTFGTTVYASAANIVYIGVNDGATWTPTHAVHPTATVCIQEPISETVCPDQKRRKFRYLARVRNGLSDRGGRTVAIGVPAKVAAGPPP